MSYSNPIFLGKPASATRHLVRQFLQSRRFSKVYIGFSGTFSLETLAAGCGYDPSQLVGNDVSLYSYAIGSFLADQPFHVKPLVEEYAWACELENPIEKAAALVWVVKHIQLRRKDGAYLQALREEMETYKRGLLNRTQAALRKLKARIGGMSYQTMDALSFASAYYNDPGAVMVLDPPLLRWRL